MFRRVVILFLFIVLGLNCRAQQNVDSAAKADTLKPWKVKSLTTLTVAQTTYRYWAQGGENSFSGIANSHIVARYRKINGYWENIFDATYGLMEQGDKGLIKTDDKFEFTSNFAFKASDKWNYNALINLKSQFSRGFKYPDDSTVVSDFFSPAYLITSFGLEYKRKYYRVMLSVLTGKTTFVTNKKLYDAGAYGVDKGKKLKTGLGSYLKFIFKKEVVKNVELNNSLELFSDYFNNPQYIDVNWEVLLKMKINSFMSAIINTNLIYDYDTKVIVKNAAGQVISSESKVQFKETFGIGFMVSL
ncbi:MAG: DUF3078 domain-containing protein [Bacteroidetes bacterium]|nr:DUF3078 domain-containing protein [Bacteroidota bacterium]